MNTNGKAFRQTWMIVWAFLVICIFLCGGVCIFTSHLPQLRKGNPSLPTLKPFFVLLGLTALCASVGWMRFKIDARIGEEGRELSPAEFQNICIVAMALAEACTLFGLVLFSLGASLIDFLLFAAGTILVDVAFVLPRGLRFHSKAI